jgi:hypothetical protein
MDWIDVILESVRDLQCPNCGARLASSGVRGITAERTTLIVRLACNVCGEGSVAIVQRDRPELADPITRDDVLDAHEFLKRWNGPLADALGIAKRAA